MITTSDLYQIELFENLDNEILERIAASLKERVVPKGNYLLYADDPGTHMFFVAEGRVNITLVSESGKEFAVATLKEGDFLGEMAIITGETRCANAVALTDCKLLVMSASDFARHLVNSPAFLRAMVERLRTSSAKCASMAFDSLQERILSILRGLAKPSKRLGWLLVESKPTHQQLATMTGTTREAVSRIMKSLEREGMLEAAGSSLHVAFA